jgi:hypothetical protein
MMPDLPRGTSQTPHRVPDTAYDTWLTKAQAAAAIGRSEKAVQRLAADGLIQQASCQAQGRGPFRTVYHPDDVARIASARRAEAVAFVLPAGVDGPSNGNGHPVGISPLTPLTIANPAPLVSPEQLASFWCNFVEALQAVSKTSRTPEPPSIYMTMAEAVTRAGISERATRTLIKARGVRTVRDQTGVHPHRAEFEALL